MKNLKLYQGNDEMEAAQLRSVLLFSEFGNSSKRTDMMPRVLLSYIIKEKGQATLDSITQCFNTNFKANHKTAEFKSFVEKLINKNLVKEKNGCYSAISDQKEGTLFFERLDKDTTSLINGIIQRYEHLSKTTCTINRSIIEQNVTNALSTYFKLASLSIVNNPSFPPVSDSVKAVLKNLQEKDGERLVSAIGQTIQQPTDKERDVLNEWAKAFLLTQILKIDPTLVNFKMSLIRQKSFVLDTDIVLNILATDARHSKEYRTLIAKLQEIGCSIYVPQDVKKEVEGHADQACKIAKGFGTSQLDNFTSYELEGPQSNVFIEDYVKSRRACPNRKNMAFETYIRNIYIKGHPNVLHERLRSVLGENVNKELKEVSLDENIQERLKKEINERTIDSFRGITRKLEINKSLSETDAKIYLTLRDYNKSVEEEGLLKYKFYFLTQSTRTIRAARDIGIYDFDIICHPEALAVVLTEIGQLPKGDISVINLFENPFLAHAATAVWDRVEPVLQEGFQINYKELEQLRADVDVRFDEFLLSDNPQERVEYAQSYRKLGYTFANDLANMDDEIKKLRVDNYRLEQEREEQIKDNEKMRIAIERDKKKRKKEKYFERLKRCKKSRR